MIPSESSDQPQPLRERDLAGRQDSLPKENAPSPAADVAPMAAAVEPHVGPPDDPFRDTSAVWYVQPPAGRQYGPASSDVMRSWVAGGRIHERCLVWRDGWPEWRSASTILARPGHVETSSAGETGDTAGVMADWHERPTDTINSRRRNSNSTRTALLILAVLVGIVLLGGLIMLWLSDGQLKFGA